MKVGDLVKWTNYAVLDDTGQYCKRSHLGFITKIICEGNIRVYCEGKHLQWNSWQCEMVSKAVRVDDK